MSIASYLSELVSQKNNLAANLVTKGVSASTSETLNTLVPKVLSISGGGGGAVLSSLTVTENGDYTPGAGIDGFNAVHVSVPGSGGSGKEDEIIDGTLSEYENYTVISIRSGMFQNYASLVSVKFGAVVNIGSNAFSGCGKLTTISFPNAVSMGLSAFYSCSSLAAADFPRLSDVPNGAFRYCGKLVSASFPMAQSIGAYAFNGCFSLSTICFPMVVSITASAFSSCFNLTEANFPAATYIGQYAFQDCSKLSSVSFPNVTEIGQYAFKSCISLQEVNFPAAKTIGGAAFNSGKLVSASFPAATYIGSSAFLRTLIRYLYLMGSSVCSLETSQAFFSTPMATSSESAFIYVPASLVTAYQTANQWSFFSSRFVGV